VSKVDSRDTPEQAELRRAARQLARRLSAATVAELDDEARTNRLQTALGDTGWAELRADGGEGAPVASGVEVGIVAEALGAAVADVPFSGPILAGDLARRAGASDLDGAVAAFSPALVEPAIVLDAKTTSRTFAVDCQGEVRHALVLVPEREGFLLGNVPIDSEDDPRSPGTDLTRRVRFVRPAIDVQPVTGQLRLLTQEDLRQWIALGLVLTSADLVGVMRGALDLTVEYAKKRHQYGKPVGSFQAVQHLLAESRCLMEGSLSIALYAAWAIDSLPAPQALAAGRAAKAYCARAARTVCETAIQVHGGIGNTWDCLAHVFLRRALLSTQWFGDDGVQLAALQRERLGVC
jgi:alkylation response protein AidB-like acyl-CoA dehydrogenase